MQKFQYKIYPSLLDNFTRYLNSDQDEAFKGFIDKINRVPFTSEAASKGTAFNVLVDSINNGYDKLGEVATKFDGFEFSTDLVKEFADYFKGSLSQYRTHGTLKTSYGDVLLYGDIDELRGDIAFDIKTTGRYEFPKFIRNWQHRLYPYCLHQEGIPIKEFEYTVTDFKNTYQERYAVDIPKFEKELTQHVEHLINFIETHRDLITDKKIFALDE